MCLHVTVLSADDWRSFTLILQALDYSNHSVPAVTNLIDEATYSGLIDPSAEWHTLNHNGARTRLTYRIRVKCDDFYYNLTCTKFCRARDDPFGHYRCNPNGDKECIEGWKGTNCEEPVCKNGCHPIHGKCDKPGSCKSQRTRRQRRSSIEEEASRYWLYWVVSRSCGGHDLRPRIKEDPYSTGGGGLRVVTTYADLQEDVFVG
nr:protein serrate-like [Onthophagus taurus]